MHREDRREQPATYFAPPHRLDHLDIESLRSALAEDPILKSVLESIGDVAFVINETRQVIEANSATRQAALFFTGEEPFGKRPGEMVGCVHSSKGPAGCGTSAACRYCAALSTAMEAFEKDTTVEKEALLSVEKEGRRSSLDLTARATALQVGDRRFVLVVLRDISAIKRREALERIFLHDALNVAGGIVGLSQFLSETSADPLIYDIERLANTLVMEIRGQQTLLEAENGRLTVENKRVAVEDLFEDIEAIFASHAASDGKNLSVTGALEGASVSTDKDLILRVLVNMVKNAFEAISTGETVTLSFAGDREGGCFEVHNPGVIPEDVATHIFKRSFTTKSERGHGLGTYSMKLLGENYLGGRVSFDTDPLTGTVFRIVLPSRARV